LSLFALELAGHGKPGSLEDAPVFAWGTEQVPHSSVYNLWLLCPRIIYSIAINRVHVHECVAPSHLQLPMELLGLLAAARRIAFSGQLHSHMHCEREHDFWALTANRHRKKTPCTSAHYRVATRLASRVAAGGTGIAQEGRTSRTRALSQQHLDRPKQVQDGLNKRHAHLRVAGSGAPLGSLLRATRCR
jgi:hypothetical protein